jgi:hypothetical protein
MSVRILICDDESTAVEQWKGFIDKHIMGAHEIVHVDAQGVEAAIEALQKRRIAQREPEPAVETSTLSFDGADLLIIDNDILRTEALAFTGSPELAYLARCYSKCGPIVVLNRFTSTFDLRLVSDDRDLPFIDLDIKAEQLDCAGLWRPSWVESGREFRPWSWPVLTQEVKDFEARVEWVARNLDQPVLDCLGFDAEMIRQLGYRARERFWLHQDPNPNHSFDEIARKVTFRQFILGEPEDVPNEERLGGPAYGLRAKDKQNDPELIARIAAARVTKWLRNYVLPGQDVLVDAPHLFTRLPGLMPKAAHKDLARWNALTRHPERRGGAAGQDGVEGDHRHDTMTKLGIEPETMALLEPFRCFKEGPPWFPFPVWSWPGISRDEGIEGTGDSLVLTKRPFRFCEDTSNFQAKATSVRTDVDSQFVDRWVHRTEDTGYSPRARLFR